MKKPIVTLLAYEHRQERAVALILKAKTAEGERVLRKHINGLLKKAVKMLDGRK